MHKFFKHPSIFGTWIIAIGLMAGAYTAAKYRLVEITTGWAQGGGNGEQADRNGHQGGGGGNVEIVHGFCNFCPGARDINGNTVGQNQGGATGDHAGQAGY